MRAGARGGGLREQCCVQKKPREDQESAGNAGQMCAEAAAGVHLPAPLAGAVVLHPGAFGRAADLGVGEAVPDGVRAAVLLSEGTQLRGSRRDVADGPARGQGGVLPEPGLRLPAAGGEHYPHEDAAEPV